MSVLIRYSIASLTVEQYDEALRRLQTVGEEWPPNGLEYHACYGPDGNLQVVEIWYSRAQLEEFGQWLTPLLANLGVELGEPEVFEIHNVLRG